MARDASALLASSVRAALAAATAEASEAERDRLKDARPITLTLEAGSCYTLAWTDARAILKDGAADDAVVVSTTSATLIAGNRAAPGLLRDAGVDDLVFVMTRSFGIARAV